MEKDPRDKKQFGANKEEVFQEPASRGAGQEPESEEEAPVESFAEPKVGEDYTEEAAYVEVQSMTAGIPSRLLEFKKQIESSLANTATAGAIQVEAATEGTRNIVGVGIGLGEPHPTPGTPSLSTGISPGEHALNVYVAELTSIDEV